MSNRILLIVFLLLLAIFGISRIFSDKNERSFDPDLVKVDSTQVTSVIVQSKADGFEQVLLRREAEGWTVSKNNLTQPVDPPSVHQLLAVLSYVRSSYIAAKKEEKWDEFELKDGQASHIVVYGGNKVLADFYAGKYTVNPEVNQITSFLRLKKGAEVYAVEGMAGMLLAQGFDSYRSKQILKLDHYAVGKLDYEGDLPYTIALEGGQWLKNGKVALDSNRVRSFLLNLRNMSGETFVDKFSPEASQDKLLKKLTISGSNMPQPVIVRCWQDTTLAKPFVIQSSQFPESFFESDSTRLFARIFKLTEDW